METPPPDPKQAETAPAALSPEDVVNPLFPAARSGPTAVSAAARQKQIPSSDHEGFRALLARPDGKTNSWVISGFEKRHGAWRGKKGNR